MIRALLIAALAVLSPLAALAQAGGEREALEQYQAGRYAEAARRGAAVLRDAPQLHDLRFAVANSLAWTGQYDQALEHYRALLGTAYENRARVGMANVMRWRGQADLAEPHYLAVLEREPANTDARSGLALAGRDLRPALTARLGHSADSADLKRNELLLAYRQWSADRAWRFEVGTLGERYQAPGRDWSARGLQAALWGAKLPLAPRIDAALYDSGLRDTQVFGTLQLEPARDVLRIRFGRVNWARLAFSAGAAADGLTARTLGILGDTQLGIGSIRARADGFDTSDGNRVLDGELQVTPFWQPLPWALKWSAGLYGRHAEREDPRYWSPRPTYGLAYVGLQRGWYLERTDVTASIRRGFGLTDSAGDSWSLGLSARRWISRDFAIGLEGWAVDAPRPGAYRMHQVTAFVQHLW
jgi:tetratricopeptide (TPR) repeat protein